MLQSRASRRRIKWTFAFFRMEQLYWDATCSQWNLVRNASSVCFSYSEENGAWLPPLASLDMMHRRSDAHLVNVDRSEVVLVINGVATIRARCICGFRILVSRQVSASSFFTQLTPIWVEHKLAIECWSRLLRTYNTYNRIVIVPIQILGVRLTDRISTCQTNLHKATHGLTNPKSWTIAQNPLLAVE